MRTNHMTTERWRWLTRALALVAVIVASRAEAQDDGGFGFDLNSVLVATFEAEQPFLEAEAERVRELVADALADSYLVIGMPEVQPFENYTADVYLRSCPDGQYVGCVFVVGGRAQTDWGVGGQIRAVSGGYEAKLLLIDVKKAQLVTETDVVLDGSNDDDFKAGIRQLMDAVVAGQLDILDERAIEEAEREREEEADRFATDVAGDQLSEEEEEAEPIKRGRDGGDAGLGGGRVTRKELDDLESSGDAPWERAGLTRGQYRMYRRSGEKLRDFKHRVDGRKGQILLRLGGSFGYGSVGQNHELWYIRDNEDITRILDQGAVQAQSAELNAGGHVEIGVGILPWLEAGVHVGMRTAPYGYRFFESITGIESEFPAPEVKWTSSLATGLHIGFAPLPAAIARPLFQVGVSYWAGNKVTRVAGSQETAGLLSEEMLPNNWLLADAHVGAEIGLGKTVALWVRGDFEVPIAGRNLQAFNRGDLASLDPRPSQVSSRHVGVGGSLGLLFRFDVGRR